MEQSINDVFEKQNLPLVLAGFGFINNSGGVPDYQLAIPSHVRKKGLQVFYVQSSNQSTPALGVGGLTNSLGWVQRIGTGSGLNFTPGAYLYTLTDTDVANGYIVIPSFNISMSICGLVMWNAGAAELSLDPSDPVTNATTGFNRSEAVNTIASVAMTATKPSLHVKILVRSGSGRTTTPPSGYTLIQEAKFGGGGTVNNINTSLATKILNAGDVAGTDDWTVSGAADTTMTSFGCLLTIN